MRMSQERNQGSIDIVRSSGSAPLDKRRLVFSRNYIGRTVIATIHRTASPRGSNVQRFDMNTLRVLFPSGARHRCSPEQRRPQRHYPHWLNFRITRLRDAPSDNRGRRLQRDQQYMSTTAATWMPQIHRIKLRMVPNIFLKRVGAYKGQAVR